VAPVHAPNPLDAFLATEYVVVDQAGVATSSINTLQATLNAIVGRLKAITGTTNWYDAVATTIAALNTAVVTTLPASIAAKVAKAGDTMSGDLTVTRSGSASPTTGVLYLGSNSGTKYLQWDGSTFNLAGGLLSILNAGLIAAGGATIQGDVLAYRPGAPTTGVLYLGNNGSTTFLLFDGANFQFNGGQLFRAGNRVWDAANDGAGSGLDADLLDGLNAGNASGNIPISNGSACANLNADLVDGIHGTAFVQLTTSGNQTISSNGGQLIIGVIPSGPLAGAAGAQVVGSFSATGTKNRIATGHDGVEGVLHSIETPLPMFEEHGRAQLLHGEAIVRIPDDFANYVDLSDYYVQVTAEGPAALYVAERTGEDFVVRSFAGDPEASFTWHLVARQGDMTHISATCPRRGPNMDLRNYEFYEDSGLPLVGAAVTVYEGTLSHPPVTLITATTTNTTACGKPLASARRPRM
jgi:hypothetical protein